MAGNEPAFCSRCQQVVPAGRIDNYMRYDSVTGTYVVCR